MILLLGLVLVMVIAAAVLLRRWVSIRLQAAERRQAQQAWQEIPASPAAGAPDWPDDETGTQHFFGTDEVAYDPAADAAVYCDNMAADVQAYIDSLHQAA